MLFLDFLMRCSFENSLWRLCLKLSSYFRQEMWQHFIQKSCLKPSTFDRKTFSSFLQRRSRKILKWLLLHKSAHSVTHSLWEPQCVFSHVWRQTDWIGYIRQGVEENDDMKRVKDKSTEGRFANKLEHVMSFASLTLHVRRESNRRKRKEANLSCSSRSVREVSIHSIL